MTQPISQPSARPLPDAATLSSPFWAGARQHRLMVQRCSECQTLRFPEAPVCAKCLSSLSDWHEVDPRGKVKAWCRFHRGYFEGFALPYTVLLIELDCGVCLYSNFSEESSSVRAEVGMRVTASFDSVTSEVTLVKFKPDKISIE